MSSTDNDSNNVTEDSPVMRSVALHAGADPPLARASDAAAASPMKFPLPHFSPTTQKPGAGVAAAPAAARWRVTSAPPLPALYKLERSHLSIDNVDVATIARRIETALHQNSVVARFHMSECLAECETAEHLLFNVRLWRRGGGSTIVEVQRLSGCCFLFSQATKTVFKSAKGMKASPRRTFTIPSCVPTIDNYRAAVEESLAIASDLLKKEQRLDAHVMALESLVHLTSQSENVEFAAHAIMCGGDFLDALVCLIEAFRLCRDGDADAAAANGISAMEQDSVQMMRRSALTVLANCLSILERSGELRHVLTAQAELQSSDLLQALVDEVEHAERRPHEACQAAKCLQYLSSPANLQLMDAPVAAANAQECRHALLQNEARKLSARLQQP